MSAQHAPGPWTFVPWHIEEGPPAVRSPDGWIVATTASDSDARLIAAAPDLLEALEIAKAALLSDPPHGPQKSIAGDGAVYHLDGAKCGNALNAIRAAISKAKGEVK